MAKYLVTGGAGFIGSHLTEALIAAGHAVRCFDNLSTGERENLADLPVELVVGDIRDAKALDTAMEGCEGVFHLAAIASVTACTEDWANSSAVNLQGSLNAFECAARRGLPVVYASSAAVYGEPETLPLNEAARTTPISAYGLDKLACEHHAALMEKAVGLQSVGLRFFNVYGPRQVKGSAYSGVITIFLERWMDGTPLSVFGTGEQTRDFIYVGDVAQGLIAAMKRAAGGHSGVYNICTGRKISINDLIATIADCVGKPLPVRYLDPKDGDIQASLGDPSAAIADLGFTAPTGFGEGLKHTINWVASSQKVA